MISHWHGQKKSPAHIPIPVCIWKELGKEWEKDSNFIQICWRLLEKGRKDAGGRAGVVLAHYCLPEVSLSHTSSIVKRGELIRALLRINSNYCFDKTQKSPIIICLWKLLTALSFLKKKRRNSHKGLFLLLRIFPFWAGLYTRELFYSKGCTESCSHLFPSKKKPKQPNSTEVSHEKKDVQADQSSPKYKISPTLIPKPTVNLKMMRTFTHLQ